MATICPSHTGTHLSGTQFVRGGSGGFNVGMRAAHLHFRPRWRVAFAVLNIRLAGILISFGVNLLIVAKRLRCPFLSPPPGDLLSAEALMNLPQHGDAPTAAGTGGETIRYLRGDLGLFNGAERFNFAPGDVKTKADGVIRFHDMIIDSQDRAMRGPNGRVLLFRRRPRQSRPSLLHSLTIINKVFAHICVYLCFPSSHRAPPSQILSSLHSPL